MMERFKTIAIHGRQPALGIAELESLYGADSIQPFGAQASLITLEHSAIDFQRLGGTIRLARILAELPSLEWNKIESYLLEMAPEHAAYIEGKLSFGISVFGLRIAPNKLARTALLLKKSIKAAGHSVRMVPHTATELGSATVLYNKLTSKNGWELLIVSDGKSAYLAQTTNMQDIDAYAARDQARPMRDAKVGMLPPKLAQIIVNLGVGRIDEENGIRNMENGVNKLETPNSQPPTTDPKPLILDPFCGTGVTLQEAMLMDYDIYGTDLEPRMVEYTIANLKWLDEKYPNVGDYRRIEVGDATSHKWNFSQLTARNLQLVVAGETYLGQPLTMLPNSEHLSKIIYEANLVNHKFLLNIATQIPKGTRLCLAVPTWRGKHEFLHLPMLDHLTDMGYTVFKFNHVTDKNLIYHRENQVVGRQLLVLTRC